MLSAALELETGRSPLSFDGKATSNPYLQKHPGEHLCALLRAATLCNGEAHHVLFPRMDDKCRRLAWNANPLYPCQPQEAVQEPCLWTRQHLFQLNFSMSLNLHSLSSEQSQLACEAAASALVQISQPLLPTKPVNQHGSHSQVKPDF